MFTTTVGAATVTHKVGTADEQNLTIRIDGSLRPSDVGELEGIFAKYPKYDVRAYITSGGGDINSAMSIGRLLRAREAVVVAEEQCLSSCILAYSGGVERLNAAELASEWGGRNLPSTGIGIHRFYFSHVSPEATTGQISKARNRQKDQIRFYLTEMNVSQQLLDAMEATPPEKMRILRLIELHQFGLVRLDPVFDEKRVAQQASNYKLSSAEFRRRSAAARVHCAQVNTQRSCVKQGNTCKIDFDALFECEPNFIRSAGR